MGGYRTTSTAKEMKLSIRMLYGDLGANFIDWGKNFLPQMKLAESASQMHWSERVTLDCFCLHLGGTAEKYYCKMQESWWNQESTLFYAMNRMLEIYRTTSQAVQLFLAPKTSQRSWAEHYLYLVAASEVAGGKDDIVVENIVKYASPAMRPALMSRYNPRRFDYLAHAEELIQFAYLIHGLKTVSGKEIVNYVGGGGVGATKSTTATTKVTSHANALSQRSRVEDVAAARTRVTRKRALDLRLPWPPALIMDCRTARGS